MTANTSKVVFINRFFYPDHSATAQILSDLAFALSREGRSVHVVTSQLSYDHLGLHYPRKEIVHGVSIHRVSSTGFGRQSLMGRLLDIVSFYVTVVWKLLWVVNPGDIVVAKTDPPLISTVAAAVCKLKRAVLINWLQDLYPEIAEQYGIVKGGSVVARGLKIMRNASLHAAHTNVVIGERMAEHVVDTGIPRSAVAVIANWADDELIRPIHPEANLLRQEWMLDGRFVVGYSGNLGRAHDAETVLEAAEILKDRDDIKFLFIGSGYNRELLEKEVKRRGLINFAFKPYQAREHLAMSLSVPDVHWLSLRSNFDGLIVPSKFYGIAASGRGVICLTAAKDEIARMVVAHQCGAVIRPGDSRALSVLISQLADSPGIARS